MSRMKRLVSGLVVTCLAASSLFMNGALLTPKAMAAETTDEWAELSGILDGYKGVYTKDTKMGPSWNTRYSPDGPLMGNGTVYAFMAGDRKEQNIYISRSDMWKDRPTNDGQEYTTFGGITIRKSEGVDLALKKNITVSGFASSNEDGPKLVDGLDNTKWCSTKATNNNSSTYWAVIDLGEEKDISRWVVKHAQAGGEGAAANTKDFKLQYSTQANPNGDTEADWIDADDVVGNTAAKTDRNLINLINTRYVRLLVTKAEQGTGTTLRIYGLELYEMPKAASVASSEFRYEQDMKNAEVLAQSEQGFKTKTWLSAKENLIVTEISNMTDSPIPMEIAAWTANDNTSASVDGKMMVASKAGISKASSRISGTGTWEGWTVNVSLASKIIDDLETVVQNVDTKTNKTLFTLPVNKTVTLVSAVEGGKQDGEINTMDKAMNQAKEKVESRSTEDSLATANQAHLDYWKQYWLKSYINIQDEKVERMYYGFLYMLGCATSVSSEHNAGLSAGLFPWTGSNSPGWQGDYTTNTDMQRQVHPLVNANRLEGIQNYVNVLEAYWPEAQRRSSLAQHLNWVIQGTGRPNQFTEGIEGGALFPTHIGPWGASTEQNNDSRDYWNSPADASSVLMPLVKMWQYNQDESYLSDHLYPMLKSVAIFWENYVTLENGKYVVYGATHESVAGRNAIFDIDACVYILKNAIDAAKELGVDADKIPVWQNIIDKMSPQPTFLWNGKVTISDIEGRSQQNTGPTFDGNPVTIQSVYYYDVAGMSTPAEQKEKYINYLNVKNGIGNARRLTSATRLGYDINEIVEQLKIGSINPAPSDWTGLRGNNTIGDIGGANLLGVVQDSLLQSNEGFLNIFANWFDDQEASFTRLRAKGAFLVDANQNEFGQTTYVNIYSEKGKDCSVLNPWQGQDMEVYEDGTQIEATKSVNSLGDVYTFATKENASYELKPKGGLRNSILVGIPAPDAVVGTIGSTSVETLGLPETIVLTTNEKNAKASVTWDLRGTNYDPNAMTGQTLTVPGIVTLPVGVDNPNNIPLTTSISVTVSKIPQSQMTATATSEEAGKDVGSNAIDGNPQTVWHTKWDKSDVLPQSIILNLGETYNNINKVTVLPRPGGGNGNITGYNIYVSTDGTTFTKVATGSWANDATEKTAIFTSTNAAYVKVEATTGINGWASAAEINVFAVPAVVLPKLVGINTPAAVKGVNNGVAKTASALGLPTTVALVTDAGNVNTDVTWDVDASSYDPAVKKEQTFTVDGAVTLPEGVDNPNNVDLKTSISVTVNAETDQGKTLVSITTPTPITGIANGAAKTAEALGLPATVTLVTDDGNVNADVTWDVDNSSYNPSLKDEQTFTVDGTVELPEGVKNPNNKVELTTKISVTVNAETDQGKTLVSITTPTPITGIANGAAKTAEALGLPATVTLVTYGGSVNRSVTWEVDASSYDPSVKTAQIFTIDGNVTLPEGVENPNNVDLKTSISVTVNAETDQGKTLVSITTPTPITGIANGAAKTAEALGLPSTVELVTDGDNINANVAWNVDASSYNPSSINAQTFTVDGTVTLPEGVANPNDVPLTTQISISVKASASRPDPTPDPTPNPTPKPTPKPEDGNKPTEPTEPVKPTEPETPKVDLSDIADHWAKASIEKSVELGFVSGYEDGTFRPNGTITRGEFATMLARALKLASVDSKFSFTDQDQTPVWAQPSIQALSKAGFISGYVDGTFRANNKITRSELVVLIVRALGLEVNPNAMLAFDDADQIPAWAKPYVATAAKAGLIKGNGDGKFNPNASSTRAEAVTLILAMLSNMK